MHENLLAGLPQHHSVRSNSARGTFMSCLCKPHHSSVRLVVSTLFLLLASTLSCASGAPELHESPVILSDTPPPPANYSEDDCNIGPGAWITVKKHHDEMLICLERKTRQLNLQHPSSIESKIALAKEYRELGKNLISLTQYDKAALAYQKATVLLKDIPGEALLYNDSMQEGKACYEKKKQRAIFLRRLKSRKTAP
ncbi:MAG TPA: hypothetical protein PKH78_01770 [Candidatus Obscuribacter sp.]|nr:hypothetical protein [Candidatus Obscuribacter sp.]